MELVKILHDLAITGGAIIIAVLPRVISAVTEAKARQQD
jgi:predicted ATPase